MASSLRTELMSMGATNLAASLYCCLSILLREKIFLQVVSLSFSSFLASSIGSIFYCCWGSGTVIYYCCYLTGDYFNGLLLSCLRSEPMVLRGCWFWEARFLSGLDFKGLDLRGLLRLELLVCFLFFLRGEFSLANGWRAALKASHGAPFSEFSLQDLFTGLDPFLSGDLNSLPLVISLHGDDEFSPSLMLWWFDFPPNSFCCLIGLFWLIELFFNTESKLNYLRGLLSLRTLFDSFWLSSLLSCFFWSCCLAFL